MASIVVGSKITLTEEMIRDMKRLISMPWHDGSIFSPIIERRRSHVVHYRSGRATYVLPDQFYWCRAEPTPSDCEWMVPGT